MPVTVKCTICGREDSGIRRDPCSSCGETHPNVYHINVPPGWAHMGIPKEDRTPDMEPEGVIIACSRECEQEAEKRWPLEAIRAKVRFQQMNEDDPNHQMN